MNTIGNYGINNYGYNNNKNSVNNALNQQANQKSLLPKDVIDGFNNGGSDANVVVAKNNEPASTAEKSQPKNGLKDGIKRLIEIGKKIWDKLFE